MLYGDNRITTFKIYLDVEHAMLTDRYSTAIETA